MKFFIKDCFSKCDQMRSFLRIWSHLLKIHVNHLDLFAIKKHNTRSDYMLFSKFFHDSLVFGTRTLFYGLKIKRKGEIFRANIFHIL